VEEYTIYEDDAKRAPRMNVGTTVLTVMRLSIPTTDVALCSDKANAFLPVSAGEESQHVPDINVACGIG
jgi:hypothetical protein